MTAKRVTVVIPAYRAEASICRTVDSVLTQEGVDTHALVIVDGLLDGTLARLGGYDPGRVTVIVNEENQGAQKARNRGLAAAQSEFVMFLDSDDFVEGRLLEGLARKMSDEAADIGFGPMQVLEASGRRRPVYYRSYATSDDVYKAWMADARGVGPCSIMWRTEFIRQVGGWDETVQRNQDGEMVMRSIMRGARFAVSSEGRGVYVHNDKPGRITRRTDNLAALLEVGEKVLLMPSEAISDDVRNEGAARYFYRIALRFYSSERPDLGDVALRRARELGFRGHIGPLWHRMSASALGLRLRYHLSNAWKRHAFFGFRGFSR